jgi:hypothetical protein
VFDEVDVGSDLCVAWYNRNDRAAWQ